MTKYPKSHAMIAAAMTIFLVVVINALPTQKETNRTLSIPVSLSIEFVPNQPPLVEPDPAIHEAVMPDWKEVVIMPGDNLSSIFKRAGLTAKELHKIMSLGSKVAVLSNIKPEQSLQFRLNDDGSLNTLQYEQTELRKLIIEQSENGFDATWNVFEPEILISYRSARITVDNPSLYHAGKAAGMSDKLIMKLSHIFQWDISFALDLRQGDTFALLYEDIYFEGKRVKTGKILAAQFNNFGKTVTAVSYQDEHGNHDYFTPDGRSMRKAFLRDPVSFRYVSSSFNLKRLHPIHKRVMPHRGIDYAANRGTPVVAAGDGKVSTARRNSSSGRYIVISHGEQYTTKYLHLSGYAKGIRAGKTVKQGQIIGYVGATGWATAPHLHYEFLVNGVHRNPRTVKLPKAQPIAKANMDEFKLSTRALLTRLESVVGRTGYASISE